MKKIKIKLWNSTGYSGCTAKEEIEHEVEDNATQEEIDKECQGIFEDWMANFDHGWFIEELK